MGRRSNEVEAHGVSLNTNESVEADEARKKLASNTNEDALEEDEVEAHGVQANTNEDAADDDTEAHSRDGWGSNTNETAEIDES